jgi:hypothetical protein
VLGDAPNVPLFLQELAEDTDAAIEGQKTRIDALEAVDATDPVIVTGNVALAGDATNQRFVDVTFDTPFPGAPIIMLQCLTGMANSSTTHAVWPSNETVSGFRCNGVRNNTTTMTVRWVAIYLP